MNTFYPITRQVLIAIHAGKQLPNACIYALNHLECDGYIIDEDPYSLGDTYKLTDKGVTWVKNWEWLQLTKPIGELDHAE